MSLLGDVTSPTTVAHYVSMTRSEHRETLTAALTADGVHKEAIRSSPPTARVPSSHLGHSVWVPWWTKRGLGRFFTVFLPFSPTTNFLPPFLHTHLIHFVSFHPPL